MSEERLPSPTAIDLSKSNFRGSGALYQADRLTLGRSKTIQVLGTGTNVIEKVVYKESEGSTQIIDDLKNRLKEALLRLLVVSADHKRLMSKADLHTPGQNQKPFDHSSTFEMQSIKSELYRLNQMMADKDKEILTIKQTETRKSAIQSGELTIRLSMLNKENNRLQAAHLDKINQLAHANAELHRLREVTVNNNGPRITFDPRMQELERVVFTKDQEIEGLRRKTVEAGNLERDCFELKTQITVLEGKYRQAEDMISHLRRENTKNQVDSQERGTMETQFIETLQRERDSLTQRLRELEPRLSEKEASIHILTLDLQKVALNQYRQTK